MQWLIKEVLPIIKEKIPDVKLTIIGKGLPRKFFRLNNPNIEIVGYIEDVIPYLSRANIYVAPLFVGGGVRIKILEALAMKLPVVATPVSAEGIHTGNENGLFIADNKYDFANAVIMLLNDYNKARELGEQGRNFVVNNFSWEKSVSTIIHKYKELLNHQSIQEHIPADI
jgi:glycosyltransferase involved in cell wall biosynthesis